MTTLSGKLVRETATLYRSLPLVIELHPQYVVLHVKGKRATTTLPYDVLFEFGLKRDYLKEKLCAKHALSEKRAARGLSRATA